jgi:hypothetical protein
MKILPHHHAKKSLRLPIQANPVLCIFKASFLPIKIFLLLTATLSAEPGARLIVPKSEAWTGQRIPIFVELRAEGSFKGAASFDLPEIPQTIVIKVGNPVLSSEKAGDTEVFVQRHEFALFSQADGTLLLPPITARFSHTKGYTGPTFDTSTKTAPTTLTLKRPPNSESIGFIVTTGSLEIEESWNPSPGPLETGTVIKRNIFQRATELTGIALKSAPAPEIEGIKTYTGNAEVTDKTERGDFIGERRETITYLVQQPGLHTLPEIRYDWWDPESNTLEFKILPSVSFTATAPPIPPEKRSPVTYFWLFPAIFSIALLVYARRPIIPIFHRLHERIDPPEKRAARYFLKACQLNEPATAAAAWNHYRRLAPRITRSESLEEAIQELYSILYGKEQTGKTWKGDALAHAFRQSLLTHTKGYKALPLPELNP